MTDDADLPFVPAQPGAFLDVTWPDVEDATHMYDGREALEQFIVLGYAVKNAPSLETVMLTPDGTVTPQGLLDMGAQSVTLHYYRDRGLVFGPSRTWGAK